MFNLFTTKEKVWKLSAVGSGVETCPLIRLHSGCMHPLYVNNQSLYVRVTRMCTRPLKPRPRRDRDVGNFVWDETKIRRFRFETRRDRDLLAGLPANQLNRLQSVLHAAARLIYGASRRDHVKPLLRQLHWLSVPERLEFKLCVLTYRCLHGLGPVTSPANLREYPTSVQDKDYARRLLQL